MPKAMGDKRKVPTDIQSLEPNGSQTKRRKKTNLIQPIQPQITPSHPSFSYDERKSTSDNPFNKRLNRLEQNRRAAKVSRERKKFMVDELQRSVTVFKSANASLKVQNEELVRLIGLAQKLADEGVSKQVPKKGSKSKKEKVAIHIKDDQTVPSTLSSNAVTPLPLVKSIDTSKVSGNFVTSDPSTESSTSQAAPTNPNAIMQAMSNFQQAATDAMYAAMQARQQNPTGVSAESVSHPIPDAQQAYMDTMAALAIQNSLAAANADGSSPDSSSVMLGSLPFKMGPFFTWQQAQQNQLQQ